MLMQRSMFVFLLVSAYAISSCKDPRTEASQSSEMDAETLTSVDGPYVYSQNDSLTTISVERKEDATFFIRKNKQSKASVKMLTTYADNADKDHFSFSLVDEYQVPDAIYEAPDKMFVISDIEGNFNAFYSLLISNQIMGADYNWTFGTGHLVIAGDMMDRGVNVLPCLWLLYKLEQEAKKAGGQVHYILGNHDVMNLQLDLRYTDAKYHELAKLLSGIAEDEKAAYQYLMSDTNELVKWIMSKNVIEKIGDNLVVHGGISREMVDAGLSIKEINNSVRANIRKNLYRNPMEDEYANLILGRRGPLWYRGVVKDYKEYYKKIDGRGLDYILDFFEVERMIVGHTIVGEEITSDFNGRVIRVAIKHSSQKFSAKSGALFINEDSYFKVNALGEKERLDIGREQGE